MQMFIGGIVVAACLGLAMPVCAAVPAGQVYRDEDPSAMAIHAPPGRGAAFRTRLNTILAHNPDDVGALSHRAYLFLRAGDEARANRDFERALTASTYGSTAHRQVLWGYGWALYDMGKIDDALRIWQTCADLHGGRPHWVPYTFALAYWSKGDRASALAWYDVAVESFPKRGDPVDVVELTSRWRPEQRETMASLFAAWTAHRQAARQP
jgi:tetratricopeptide (TPR) repeat protein